VHLDGVLFVIADGRDLGDAFRDRDRLGGLVDRAVCWRRHVDDSGDLAAGRAVA
jgi:hypothetical protein